MKLKTILEKIFLKLNSEIPEIPEMPYKVEPIDEHEQCYTQSYICICEEFISDMQKESIEYDESGK